MTSYFPLYGTNDPEMPLDVEARGAEVNGKSIVELVGAAVHEAMTVCVSITIHCGVEFPSRRCAYLQIAVISMDCGELIDEIRLGPGLGDGTTCRRWRRRW
jgi:hypothetical protein